MNLSNKPTQEDLRENKRELFDGMRAYQQSEISHASHAISMLLGIAAAAGAVVVAMLFPDTSPRDMTEIAWGLFIVVALLAIAVAWTTHLKINADHVIYANYGEEYVKTCQLLGFYNSVDIDGSLTSVKLSPSIGQGTGYRKTQIIVWVFAGALVFLALLFAVLFPCLA